MPQNEGPNERGLARPHHKKILSVVEGFIVSLAVSAALNPLVYLFRNVCHFIYQDSLATSTTAYSNVANG